MCEKCLYRANCQFLAKRKPCKVEGCTAFKSEKELIADTVRKMHSEIKERCIKGGIYPAFVASTIDQIANELMEGIEW